MALGDRYCREATIKLPLRRKFPNDLSAHRLHAGCAIDRQLFSGFPISAQPDLATSCRNKRRFARSIRTIPVQPVPAAFAIGGAA